MKRIWPILLVLALGVCLIGQAEELPGTVERNVPLEGADEARTYTLVKDAQGRFSIYVDEGIYEALQTDTGMTIRQKGGDATMTLTCADGAPKALRDAYVTPEMRNDDSFWDEEFSDPVAGFGVVFEEGDKVHSVYWFDAGNGKTLVADFSLLPEEQEGHGVRMWDMLDTLVF